MSLTRRAMMAAAALLVPSAARAGLPSAEALRRDVGAPAAGVGVSGTGGKRIEVTGRRSTDHEAPVREGDLWHLGSITKSMTAVLAMRLVEAGRIRLSDTLGARLGPLAGQAGDADLLSLLRHRGGAPANPPGDVLQALRAAETGDLRADRLSYLEATLDAAGGPLGRFLYSNAGYVAAAAMMEEATGKTWEALIAREVFAPLGLSTAGFGPPGADLETPDQPWGHHKTFFATTSHPPTPAADNIAAMNPAGRVHMSLSDFLTYLSAHARRAPLLRRESWDRLHAPVSDADARYAAGWVAPGAAVRMHSGSNTIWFATGGFNDAGEAAAIVVNIGDGGDLPGPVELPILEHLTRV